MRMLLATASAIGMAIVSTGNVSALPANGSVIQDAVNSVSHVDRARYYYTYRYHYYAPRYRYYYRYRYY